VRHGIYPIAFRQSCVPAVDLVSDSPTQLSSSSRSAEPSAESAASLMLGLLLGTVFHTISVKSVTLVLSSAVSKLNYFIEHTALYKWLIIIIEINFRIFRCIQHEGLICILYCLWQLLQLKIQPFGIGGVEYMWFIYMYICILSLWLWTAVRRHFSFSCDTWHRHRLLFSWKWQL